MTGPGQQYKYSTGEKIVNAIASGLLWAATPAIWAYRAINKVLPEKRERMTPNEPVKPDEPSNSQGN